MKDLTRDLKESIERLDKIVEAGYSSGASNGDIRERKSAEKKIAKIMRGEDPEAGITTEYSLLNRK